MAWWLCVIKAESVIISLDYDYYAEGIINCLVHGLIIMPNQSLCWISNWTFIDNGLLIMCYQSGFSNPSLYISIGYDYYAEGIINCLFHGLIIMQNQYLCQINNWLFIDNGLMFMYYQSKISNHLFRLWFLCRRNNKLFSSWIDYYAKSVIMLNQ